MPGGVRRYCSMRKHLVSCLAFFLQAAGELWAHTHPTGSSFNAGKQFVFGSLQSCYCHLPIDSRKLLQKLIQGLSTLKVIEQCLKGHSCSTEARCATHDLWITHDDGWLRHVFQ